MISKILLAAAYRPSGAFGERWLLNLSTTNDDFAEAITSDQSGNLFVGGYTDYVVDAAIERRMFIARINKYGSLLWIRRLQGLVNAPGLACDSAGNVFGISNGLGLSERRVYKVSSSGTFNWQKELFISGGIGLLKGIAVDSAGNAIVCSASGYVIKLSSAGAIVWQRKLSAVFNSVTIDSEDSIIVAGSYTRAPLGTASLAVKFNSAGTVQWQRFSDSFGTFNNSYVSVSVDAERRVYVTGKNSVGTNVLAYSASGTLLWAQNITGGNLNPSSVKAYENNVFVSFTEADIPDNLVYVKFNSSGGFVWQRRLEKTGCYSSSAQVTTNNSILYYAAATVAATASTTNEDVLITSLPADGTLTGTYGSLTYDASTFSSAAATLDTGTPSLAATTTSVTASDVSTVLDAVTMTASLTPL